MTPLASSTEWFFLPFVCDFRLVFLLNWAINFFVYEIDRAPVMFRKNKGDRNLLKNHAIED
jgi:hypothetical protein